MDADGYAMALSNECDALIVLKQLEAALTTCTEATGLEAANANSYYNLAAVHALMNRPDAVFEALEKNIELGDRDHQYLASDEWFRGLRDDPRFTALLERMRAE